jgi:hypothetical protein
MVAGGPEQTGRRWTGDVSLRRCSGPPPSSRVTSLIPAGRPTVVAAAEIARSHRRDRHSERRRHRPGLEIDLIPTASRRARPGEAHRHLLVPARRGRLAVLPGPAVEDLPGERVTALTEVGLHLDLAAVWTISPVAQQRPARRHPPRPHSQQDLLISRSAHSEKNLAACWPVRHGDATGKIWRR